MLSLYSYPNLFGVADNNPFGLKVYAFLKLCGRHFAMNIFSTRRKHHAGSYPIWWTATDHRRQRRDHQPSDLA